MRWDEYLDYIASNLPPPESPQCHSWDYYYEPMPVILKYVPGIMKLNVLLLLFDYHIPPCVLDVFSVILGGKKKNWKKVQSDTAQFSTRSVVRDVSRGSVGSVGFSLCVLIEKKHNAGCWARSLFHGWRDCSSYGVVGWALQLQAVPIDVDILLRCICFELCGRRAERYRRTLYALLLAWLLCGGSPHLSGSCTVGSMRWYGFQPSCKNK